MEDYKQSALKNQALLWLYKLGKYTKYSYFVI